MNETTDRSHEPPESAGSRLALALGGGAARGLAHIGVLGVLEREGLRPCAIAGSSMGALVGALSAAGLRARDITELARHFRFPRFFLFGRTLTWEQVFPSAARALQGVSFAELAHPLLTVATDLQEGKQVVLTDGAVLPAVRASCAVPGVFWPEHVDDRWLVDGGLINILPVDVAWMASPDVVMAVNVGGLRTRRLPQLDWPVSPAMSRLGRWLPNPATAKISFDLLLRASEIALTQQATLATAMTGPELLVEPALGNFGLDDFSRLDDAVAAGARATEQALPALAGLLAAPPRDSGTRTLHTDPVCRMVVNLQRARAETTHAGVPYYFCSENCRDAFLRAPDRYVRGDPRSTVALPVTADDHEGH